MSIVPAPLLRFYHRMASPPHFYSFTDKLLPWLVAICVLLLVSGLYLGLYVAPTDYQQGDSYRIIYVHVPAAWMSLFIYMVMAVSGGIGLIWRMKIADVVAISSAPIGASFTFIALVTGSLWGKPMWGTWWVWDARLTSELILLFIYMGYMALQSSIDDVHRADKAGALFITVGAVNIPIIYFSVQWWNTLHQGSSINFSNGSGMAATMLWTMLIMALGFWMYSIAIALKRVRCEILEREKNTHWVRELTEVKHG